MCVQPSSILDGDLINTKKVMKIRTKNSVIISTMVKVVHMKIWDVNLNIRSQKNAHFKTSVIGNFVSINIQTWEKTIDKRSSKNGNVKN